MTTEFGRAGLPAVIVMAHDTPQHLHRLLTALSPLPVFLHIDANTPDETYAAMTAGLRENVRLLPRLAAGWARFEIVEAELEGYRAALAQTDAQHIILATGTDYPLTTVASLVAWLAARTDRSYGEMLPLPKSDWGPMRGYDRFLFASLPWRRHRLIWPIPRRKPRGVQLAGGTQNKILSRRHAQLVLNVLDARPGLLRWFRRCWTPDEVLIPSLLLTEQFGGRWSEEGTSEPYPWFIDWGKKPAKSPRWLEIGDLEAIRTAASQTDVPALFARKFSDDSAPLVAAIDEQLRR